MPVPDDIIRVAPKKKGRKSSNIFFDDRGFPDQSNDFDYLLHNTVGNVIRKRKHPAPSLDDIDPAFFVPFDRSTHGAILDQQLKIDHLPPDQQQQLRAVIINYWSVFNPDGLHVPVRDYECVIDTGNHRPISVQKIHYGPREIPIMEKSIAALLKLGHIKQIHGGSWQFKALLAAKPHQEDITNIDNFVWRFCVNYIPLNMITCLIAYPIPRCDAAVSLAFGDGKWFWLMDAPQGYHQLRVEKSSQDKLAFAGPNATKYTYLVMPFGPVNGPAIFIMFMHDIDGTWKEVATSRGIKIDGNTNTRLIVDDCFNWATSFSVALQYMACQLQVCMSQNLSLNLKKCHFFPKRVEFVGYDVSADGNRPAQSKHNLLKTWPYPTIVRDVMSFVGFAIFFSSFIPNFELRIQVLRHICTYPIDLNVKELFTTAAHEEFDDIRNAILADPCLHRFDHRLRVYLRTDFSAKGFAYVATQPGDDEASRAAMTREMKGGPSEFMKPDKLHLTLHPIAFGARKTRGYETRLHSHLGEAFAGDWAMNRCRHYLYGARFTWYTDCYAIKFLLSYDGPNAPILRLQMRLMCWDMDVVHRAGELMVDADYFSRLGADLNFDPLLQEYNKRIFCFKRDHPAPTALPMHAENMPGYRGPRLPKAMPSDEPPIIDVQAHATMASIFADNCNGHVFLENIPICFMPCHFVPSANAFAFHNDNLPIAARHLSQFDWAIYGFNNGHFHSVIASTNLPFNITLACDPTAVGRACFSQFSHCHVILDSLRHLLDHIRSNPSTSFLHGYLIHSHRFLTSSQTSQFWRMQASVITLLHTLRSLQLFIAFVHPDNDAAATASFVTSMKRDRWVVSSTDIYFPDFGDSISSSTTIIIGVHRSTESKVDPIIFKTPPFIPPSPIESFIWRPFNTRDMALSFSKDDSAFNTSLADSVLTASIPVSGPTIAHTYRSVCLYHLHRSADNHSLLRGSDIMDTAQLCPPFNGETSTNMFGHFFGIEYRVDDHIFVRAISPFEFVSCFRLIDALTYKLSHPSAHFLLDSAIPMRTSCYVFDIIHSRLQSIRDANSELLDPSHFAAPAATCQAFLNGAIGTKLPDSSRWIKAYDADPECALIRRLIVNPSLVSKRTLADVHFRYRQPLRASCIVIEQDMLVLREPLAGDESFIKLRIVPISLRNILFIAFHSNPIGGHFNAYRTFSRLRLRYFWPGMYRYCVDFCRKCPACALANSTTRRSRELVYSFPIEAPFMVLHADIYQAGAHSSFEGNSHYLITCCGMTTFGCMEPVSKPDSTHLASAIMKICLKFGLCHTLVLDKDSKFFSVFRATCDLLNINCHVLSGDNHDAMIVERLNRYLNKGLTVLSNERDSVRIAQEAILLLIYAWNSAPIPGTDLSRSLVAIGREFSFPIDFSSAKHLELTSSASTIKSFAHDQATLLKASRLIAQVLIDEHRCYHRELINSTRPDPRLFSVGDIVFARRAVRSDARKERVDKLMFAHTGPWRVIEKLSGSSYRLQHCLRDTLFEKKHAAHLSPYPLELVPFTPLDGPDNQFGQLYKPISAQPFAAAGINGFEPIQPFKLPIHYASVIDTSRIHFPSLSELNEEFQPFPWKPGEEDSLFVCNDDPTTSLYTGPPPAPPAPTIFSIPTASELIASIIRSDDKLFFIAWQPPNSATREWRLARVAFEDSVKLHPACLQDGRFLLEFYILHEADIRYNGINQRYWLQYHKQSDLVSPNISSSCHLIRPSSTSTAYAASQNLQPLRQWITLTHLSTYIHGPFDFAVIHGRKTRDRIDRCDWEQLLLHKSRFTNPTPKFDLPTFSVHVDRLSHDTFHSDSIIQCLLSTAHSQVDILHSVALLTKGPQ